MKMNKVLIIPDKTRIADYMELADRYKLGFEYNDFFLPKLLDDEKKLEETQKIYLDNNNIPSYCTMHGAFLDVTVFSDDSLILKASDYRVEQSLSIAENLGAKGVVFHTNYIANFKTDSYRRGFVERNVEYWSKKLEEHKDIQIYIENMFDDTPELIAELGASMSSNERFGICFDYAHAHVFGDEHNIEDWVVRLAPYVKHIHINDNDYKSDLHLAVGDGLIDWNMFKYYYEKYFSESTVLIEVNGLEKIKSSLEFLNNL